MVSRLIENEQQVNRKGDFLFFLTGINTLTIAHYSRVRLLFSLGAQVGNICLHTNVFILVIQKE
jgi:hypothetical protein